MQGYSLAHGSNVSMYESLAHQPELAQRFAAAMQLYVSDPGYNLEHVANGYTWGSLKQDAVVVDVSVSPLQSLFLSDLH